MPYDYSKNGLCKLHGAFNTYYSSHCKKCCPPDEEAETGDDNAEMLAEIDRTEARAINADNDKIRF